MAKSINERFFDFQVAQQIRWIRYQNKEVAEALRILRRVDSQLAEALRNADPGAAPYTQARLLALKAQVTNLISTLHEKELAPVLMENLTKACVLAAEIEEQAFRRILPAGLDVTTPNLGVLQVAATVRPFNGAPMKEWVDQLREADLARSWRTIVDGITSGVTTDDLIQKLIGSPALRYKDGVREVTRRGLEALVRTSINHATNQGRQVVWEANQDIIRCVRWVSTLDTRTTPICQHRDGRVGPVTEDPDWTPPEGAQVLDPPLARPPAHLNCRSTTVAVTKSWRELGFDVDDLPPATRASMNGQVPANMTYYEWLKSQSEEVQRDILGPTRFDMWKRGDFTPEQFVNDQGRLLTLKELREQSLLASGSSATQRVRSSTPVLVGTHFTNADSAAKILQEGFNFDASGAATWQGSGLHMFEGDVEQQGNFGSNKILVKHTASRTFVGSTTEIQLKVAELKKTLVPPVAKLPDGSVFLGFDGQPFRTWTKEYTENAALRAAWLKSGYDSLRDTDTGVFVLFDPGKIVEITLDGKPIKFFARAVEEESKAVQKKVVRQRKAAPAEELSGRVTPEILDEILASRANGYSILTDKLDIEDHNVLIHREYDLDGNPRIVATFKVTDEAGSRIDKSSGWTQATWQPTVRNAQNGELYETTQPSSRKNFDVLTANLPDQDDVKIIKLLDSEKLAALRNLVRIEVPGDDLQSVEDIFRAIRYMGIDVSVPTKDDRELLYLVRVGTTNVDVFRGYYDFLGNNPAASTTERLQKMKDLLQTHWPNFVYGDYQDVHQSIFGYGRVYTYRLDWLNDPGWAEFERDYYLFHSWSYAGAAPKSAEFFDMILNSGGSFVSLTERLRRGISSLRSASWDTDMEGGGGDYFFTRIRQRFLYSTTSPGLEFKPRLAARTDAISYGGDMFGKTDDRDFIVRRRAKSLEDLKKNADLGSSNELILKGYQTIFDDLQYIVVNPNEVQEVIDTFRKHKIDRWPDGRALEEVIVPTNHERHVWTLPAFPT